MDLTNNNFEQIKAKRTLGTCLLMLVFMSIGSFGIVAQHNPFIKQYENILILNATAHIGNGEVINKAAVGVKEGKIILVKNALTYKPIDTEWDTIIDYYGKHLYPAFIAANSILGLVDIESIRATRDYEEVGALNPNARTLVAFNTDSPVIPTVRSNGVLIVQATPQGGRISGTSSLMHLNGWNWEDAVLIEDDGIHINWPQMYQQTGWWAEPGGVKENKKYREQRDELIDYLKKAKSYTKTKDQVRDLKMNAFDGVFEGNKRLYFHADNARELNDILLFLDEVKVKYPVIVGGYESWKLAARINEKKIPVMLSRLHKLPETEDEDIELPYRLPSILREYGIKFCIQNDGRMSAMHVRNLPFQAGTAMAYGLTEEEAVASISLSVAEIIGCADRLGSIEVGKEAHLFVSDGNALDIRSNHVVFALINGQIVDVSNHQRDLYEKYSKKYELED